METNKLTKVAVLDDYQGVALQMADWERLKGRAEITVFRDHLSDPMAVVERLKPFDVVCVMRERTPLPGSILEQLANLKLIASTGLRNASIEVEAARARGITVCGTGSSGQGADGGSGLGLTIARELVQLHGGSISVESELGRGTSFSVHLPTSGNGCPCLASGRSSA